MAGKESWYDHGKSLVSCALAGAASMVAGISDAVIIANGPAWCYFYAMRTSEGPGLHLGQRFHCTYPANDAVVFGTEKHVKEALRRVKELPFTPGLILLENSCALSLIGDDLAGFAADMDMPCPLITIDSGGLLGDYWAGYKKALLETFKKVHFTTYSHAEKRPRTVNFIGCSSHYYNECNDMLALEHLLGHLQIKVQCKVALGHTMKDLEDLGRASLNIVIHKELGEEGAQWLEKTLQMPYISPTLPYGIEGTIAWVKAVLKALGDEEEKAATACSYEISIPQLEKAFMALVDKEKGEIFEHLKDLQRLWGEPWFEKVIFSGPGSILEGMESVWQKEWFDAGQVQYVYHDSGNAYGEHYADVRSESWQDLLKEFHRGLLLGTNHEKGLLQGYLSPQKGIWSYQTIAKPVEDELVVSYRPFMALEGNRYMLDRIWNLYIEALEKESLEGDL